MIGTEQRMADLEQQALDAQQRIADLERLADDLFAYVKALRQRLDRMESPQLPHSAGYVESTRRWR